jgi:hypothetical protein
MTVNLMAFSIMTFSIMTFSIMSGFTLLRLVLRHAWLNL